jgi:hypothetical protein
MVVFFAARINLQPPCTAPTLLANDIHRPRGIRSIRLQFMRGLMALRLDTGEAAKLFSLP